MVIPVRLNDCDVPDWDLGAGRSLRSIQRADLFGERYERDLTALIAMTRRMLRPGEIADEPTWQACPQIGDVAFSGRPGSYMVTITGSAFGPPARRLPLTGDRGRGVPGHAR